VIVGEIHHVRTSSEPAPWIIPCCASLNGPLSELPSPWRGISVDVVWEAIAFSLKFDCARGGVAKNKEKLEFRGGLKTLSLEYSDVT
jgi:hypothetical protein